MSTTAKMLGVAIPVLIATTFCLSIPLIIIAADVAILAAAVLTFASERARSAPVHEENLSELE